MIGSLLIRALTLVLGYAYPAYECFKIVELNKPEIHQLRFWCQYWILVAALTIFEKVGDAFISWLPMYSEAKIAFFVYLWYPKTKGTAYVFETFFKPYVAKHETEIDRNLLELRTRAGDIVVSYSQRVASYGQTRIFEILQYIASQSPSQSSRPRGAQQPQQSRPAVPTAPARQPSVPQQSQPLARQPSVPRQSQPLARQPSIPASLSKKHVQEPTKGAGALSSVAPLTVSQPQSSSGNPAASIPSSYDTASSIFSREAEAMQVEALKDLNPAPKEALIEDAIRVTRGRLRKRTAAGGP